MFPKGSSPAYGAGERSNCLRTWTNDYRDRARVGVSSWRAEAVPAAVALVIVAGYWWTASTSFANPAISIARAMCDTFAGVRPEDVPAFIIAQIAGALVAWLVCSFLFPKAIRVTRDNAERLWSERKQLFFKPVAGHGGKAVYRGDKLTKSVWSKILGSEYIAQDIAPPSERLVKIGDTAVARKIDVRLYTYQGRLLLAAARLYQGQTTNFRAEGGGFAPVNFL